MAVIQNDVGNRYSALTIVAAITSTISAVPYPVEVLIEPTARNGLANRSSIRLDQIRTVDRRRLVKRVGAADAAVMGRVDEAIKISLGLVICEIGYRPPQGTARCSNSRTPTAASVGQ